MWLIEGDWNSSFHKKTSSRRCKSSISKLKEERGEWKEGHQLDALIVDYFQFIFATSGQVGSMDFLGPDDGSVITAMNEVLAKEFTRDEIYLAVMQMQPTKAPGQDSMPPIFFQKYLHIIGNWVSEAILQVLKTGHFPRDLITPSSLWFLREL